MLISDEVYNFIKRDFGQELYTIVIDMGLESLYKKTSRTYVDMSPSLISQQDTLKDFAREEIVLRNNLPDCLSFNDWWDLFGDEITDRYSKNFKEYKNELTSEE